MPKTNTNSLSKKISQIQINGNSKVEKSSVIKQWSSRDEQQNKKLIDNGKKQAEEVQALLMMYKEQFKVIDVKSHKFSLLFIIRGGQEATLEFEYPTLYPSDMPPKYKLIAPWVREKSLKDLYVSLGKIYTENFGRCFLYLWAEAIEDSLKKENQELKKAIDEVEIEQNDVREELIQDNTPAIFEGTPIWDRSSCFTPYLAEVKSQEDVRAVLEKLNGCRKINTAWRNTYAYRYVGPKGKVIELGEDGGEPKAGGNLLTRLVMYKANNVLVFLSRRFGKKLLGSDRFKHLNDAADDVLRQRGYINTGAKDIDGDNKKERKNSDGGGGEIKKSKNKKKK